MKLYFKEGSSQWWTGVQVRDHRSPVASLSYRPSGTSQAFQSLGREMYNYFIASSGMGPGPYDIRVTDVFGQSVVASNVTLAVTTEINTGKQFPAALAYAGTGTGSGTNTGTGSSGTSTAVTKVSITNDWQTGYCANVKVTNTGASTIKWNVSFSISGTVTSLWNAVWSQSGSKLTASGVNWNENLSANTSTEFGFCANR